ncbi:MAG: hypothetical protein IKU01_02480 [Bacteroidales bacterium]|nr:hypothetical protein [Bacteroidales bacterium]
MNPLILASGMKALEKINFNKVFAAVGSVLVVLMIVVVVKRYRKKNQKEVDDTIYLKTVSSTVNKSQLTYDLSWYDTKAIILAADLDASFGNNGGWLGCNQQGVYDTMKMMKTKSDVGQLITAFGTKELNASWLKKKTPMTLPFAITMLMTNGERRKVDSILKENGIHDSELNIGE